MSVSQARNTRKRALRFMSAPRARFIKATKEIEDFLYWVVDCAIRLDYAVRDIAKSRRRSGSNDDKTRREIAIGADARRRIFTYYRLMTEMALSRAMDSYLVYLSELLSMIFRAKPETLRSSEQVTLDFVLSQSSRAELIAALIDKKVNQLSYQGMRDLSTFLSKRLNFDLFKDKRSLEHAILLVEMRNIIVHARGIVNNTFVQRVSKPPVEVGERISLSIFDLKNHMRFLSESVSEIEERAHRKFAIKLPYKVPRPARKTGARK